MSSPTIHIIDDNLAVRQSLRLLLLAEGFAVCTYASARKFLDITLPSDDDCIVTDLDMPEISGLDLLAALRKRCIYIAVIVLSGRLDSRAAAEATKLGAFDIFEKPVEPDTLLAAIRGALGRFRRHSIPA